MKAKKVHIYPYLLRSALDSSLYLDSFESETYFIIDFKINSTVIKPGGVMTFRSLPVHRLSHVSPV